MFGSCPPSLSLPHPATVPISPAGKKGNIWENEKKVSNNTFSKNAPPTILVWYIIYIRCATFRTEMGGGGERDRRRRRGVN